MAKHKVRRCFFGSIIIPDYVNESVSDNNLEALAHMAWKRGISENCYKSSFCKWFRAKAAKYPDLFQVKVFEIYPVDEFRWVGEYIEFPSAQAQL
jgi:hypothetical protein